MFFMLQRRLFNLTLNMLEVGHPKRSLYEVVCSLKMMEWCHVVSYLSFPQGENERIKSLGSQEQKSELRVVEDELTRVCHQ